MERLIEASRAAAVQNMPVNRLVVGSIPTRGDETFIYIYIFISSLWCRGESAALCSATSASQIRLPRLSKQFHDVNRK